MTTQLIDLAGFPEGYFPPERDSVLTASNMGAAHGVDRFKSRRQLFFELGHFPGIELPPRKEDARMTSGKVHEPTVLAAVARKRPDLKVRLKRVFALDPDLKIGATTDAFVDDADGAEVPLELKTCTVDRFDSDWSDGNGEPDKGRAPWSALLQSLTQSMLFNAPYSLIAAMPISPFDSRCAIVHVARHPDAEARIKATARQLYDDIAAGREPAPDYKMDRDLMSLLSPHEVPDKIADLTGDNEAIAGAVEWADLKDRQRTDAARCDEIGAMLMHKIGDAERVIGIPGFRITWKTTDFKAYSVPARSSRVLRIFDKRKPESEE